MKWCVNKNFLSTYCDVKVTNVRYHYKRDLVQPTKETIYHFISFQFRSYLLFRKSKVSKDCWLLSRAYITWNHLHGDDGGKMGGACCHFACFSNVYVIKFQCVWFVYIDTSFSLSPCNSCYYLSTQKQCHRIYIELAHD